jgi:hypothetical protein
MADMHRVKGSAENSDSHIYIIPKNAVKAKDFTKKFSLNAKNFENGAVYLPPQL